MTFLLIPARLVSHGSGSVFMVFNGSRLVFMVPGWFFMVQARFSWFQVGFHGSRLVSHGSRSVFMVFPWFRVGF